MAWHLGTCPPNRGILPDFGSQVLQLVVGRWSGSARERGVFPNVHVRNVEPNPSIAHQNGVQGLEEPGQIIQQPLPVWLALALEPFLPIVENVYGEVELEQNRLDLSGCIFISSLTNTTGLALHTLPRTVTAWRTARCT